VSLCPGNLRRDGLNVRSRVYVCPPKSAIHTFDMRGGRFREWGRTRGEWGSNLHRWCGSLRERGKTCGTWGRRPIKWGGTSGKWGGSPDVLCTPVRGWGRGLLVWGSPLSKRGKTCSEWGRIPAGWGKTYAKRSTTFSECGKSFQ
jgi:hypothetical protein